jgi:hypothetical protein
LLSNREEIMTRLVRLSNSQRLVLEPCHIDGRLFLQVDLLQAQEDGSESLARLLIDGSKVELLTTALTTACTDNAVATNGRIDL